MTQENQTTHVTEKELESIKSNDLIPITSFIGFLLSGCLFSAIMMSGVPFLSILPIGSLIVFILSSFHLNGQA